MKHCSKYLGYAVASSLALVASVSVGQAAPILSTNAAATANLRALHGEGSQRQEVGVAGTHLTLDGLLWMPRGVMIRAFVSTHEWLSDPANGQLTTAPAAADYGSKAQVAALRRYGADTMRFPVSQYYLTAAQNPPSNPSAYAQTVVQAIQTARANGFVVMIQMQDEYPSGDPNWASHRLPIADTGAAWSFLNTYFKHDRGVLYELYNEPNLPQNAQDWYFWLNGDPSGASTVAPYSVGMQTLINDLRSAGSKNVYVLDGLQLAATLEGLTPPTDPLDRLVYAVHPYQHGSDDDSQWPVQFEIPSRTYPVWADEWGGMAGSPLMLGDLPNYDIAVKLLNHLRDHQIPLSTLPFDVVNFTTTGTIATPTIPAYTPTNYDNYSTTAKGVDSGLLVKALYQSQYTRRVTVRDGVTH